MFNETGCIPELWRDLHKYNLQTQQTSKTSESRNKSSESNRCSIKDFEMAKKQTLCYKCNKDNSENPNCTSGFHKENPISALENPDEHIQSFQKDEFLDNSD
jgi:hypothetical protein